jgi:hypothetical protein
VLALVQSAEAKIIYTKTHHVIGANGVYNLDLNHDGVTDFEIKNFTSYTDTYAAFLSALPAQRSNAVVGLTPYAYALRPGVTVGPKQPFSGALMVWARTDGPQYGSWIDVCGRYLGLKFRIKGKVHYGWARLNVRVSHISITATLTGYAYETIANKAIIAGKTKGADVITVQPASLGHLAAGASAIQAWRVKQTAATTH